jgi:DNA-binding transcriptional MerR regulator
VLLALWLYATAEGVGSARALERLCGEHDAYRWLRGGVPVNHDTLSDFRVRHGKKLDELFTQLLTVLIRQGLVTLERVAQDGMRVRASAGASSFRRRKTLRKTLKAVQRHVADVRARLDDPDETTPARKKAAAERAARERNERVEQALRNLQEVEAIRAEQTGGKKARSEPRASTTDPQARVMRMGDSGFRPAYNVQMATDAAEQMIVGVHVTNLVDQGSAEAMLDEIEARTDQRPQQYLVDGGYVSEYTIDEISERGVEIFAPLPVRTNTKWKPDEIRPTDSEAVAAWRKRMRSKAGREVYKDRAALSEHTNADTKTHRTLDRFLVRGLTKVTSIALLNALTYNILRWASVGGLTT